jgi:hypothetical protein
MRVLVKPAQYKATFAFFNVIMPPNMHHMMTNLEVCAHNPQQCWWGIN